MTMAKWILPFLFPLSPLTVAANDEWDTADTAWQLTYTALHVADWSQTLDIAESCTTSSYDNGLGYHRAIVNVEHCRHYERNPILGSRPTRGEVNTYFATTLLLHTLIAYKLPAPYRRVWQMVWIVIEADVVSANARAGVRMSF